MKRLKYQPSNNQKSSPLTTKALTAIRIFVIIAEVLALSLADTANETDILLGNRYRSFSFLIFAAVPIGGFILLHYSKTNISLDCYSEDDYSGRSFSQKMHNELKKSISEDSRWKKADSLPSCIKPLLTEDFEYMLIYNKELKTFNIEPDDKKSYSYIMLAYTPEKDLCIIEYTK